MERLIYISMTAIPLAPMGPTLLVRTAFPVILPANYVLPVLPPHVLNARQDTFCIVVLALILVLQASFPIHQQKHAETVQHIVSLPLSLFLATMNPSQQP